ncbi:MAG: dihydrofolate reductase [Oscillospiraceae bacterium]|nr:dihydrofolate reductase [Oscillospiraceae bacterium]
MISILSASENWGIGKGGDLLFHLKADMKFFRTTTEGNVVIMGRKTLDSFPGGRPLKNRVNIVLTRDNSFEREGTVVVHTPEEALLEAERYGKEVYIIGGAEIYKLFLDKCDACLVTKVAACPEADAFSPNLDELPEWKMTECGETIEEDGLKFRFVKYERR